LRKASSRVNQRLEILEKAQKFSPADAGRSYDVQQRPTLDRLVAVYRHRDRVGDLWMAEDVMAAADAFDLPAVLSERGDQLLAGDRRELGTHT
jgi:hypothetical protein